MYDEGRARFSEKGTALPSSAFFILCAWIRLLCYNIVAIIRMHNVVSRNKKAGNMGKNEKENSFEQYQLSEDITEALTLLGYTEPTKIQKVVIPLILAGKNLAAKSQTGTGKTAAFAIPICEKIVWEDLEALQTKPMKGKIRKVRVTRG